MKRLLLLLAILSVVIGAHAFVSETASLENFLIRSETACAYETGYLTSLKESRLPITISMPPTTAKPMDLETM